MIGTLKDMALNSGRRSGSDVRVTVMRRCPVTNTRGNCRRFHDSEVKVKCQTYTLHKSSHDILIKSKLLYNEKCFWGTWYDKTITYSI